MTPGQVAEALIEDLSIRDPQDLDVEAIAIDSGMTVIYRPLDGCAATLVGVGQRAIATISPSKWPGRDRFSIGHELGHWSMHRGQSFICRADDFGANLETNKAKEREADVFSSHLLMPTGLITPAIKSLQSLSFRALQAVSETFATSTAATALGVTQLDNFPSVLCSYANSTLRWQLRARMVPMRWRLREALDPDSFASDLVTRGINSGAPGKQSAETWFSNDDASHYEVVEDCISYFGDRILVLLHLIDDAMLDATFDRDAWRPRPS